MTNNAPHSLTEKDLADLAKMNAEQGNYTERQPEPETIGDWAGHTPKPAQEETFNFSLEQKSDNEVNGMLLGLRPYILIRPDLDGDRGTTNINIEVGGGAELDGLGEVLEGIGQLLQDPQAAGPIKEKVAEAKAKADG